jgi:hypothetical protein
MSDPDGFLRRLFSAAGPRLATPTAMTFELLAM